MSRRAGVSTIVYGGIGRDGRHVLGLQVYVKSAAMPNALLVPIPTRDLDVTFVDGSQAEGFLDAIGEAVPRLPRPIVESPPSVLPAEDSGLRAAPMQSGYRIVLCANASVITNALAAVGSWMRPQFDAGFQRLVERLGEQNPGMAYIAIGFTDPGAINGRPFFVQYKPTNTTQLFAPGNVFHPLPFGDRGYQDIKVAFGIVDTMIGGERVAYPQPLGDMAELLSERVVGFHAHNVGLTAHYRAAVTDVRNGTTDGELLALMPEHAGAAQQLRLAASANLPVNPAEDA